ncbi:MAG: SusC/RagA family protein, partial [Rikenellaceae bacterium]|nr:SusC/RagA family protein [Rikenellaceae bacterium]
LQTPRHILWELYDDIGNRHYLVRTNFENSTSGENTANMYNWFAMQELDNRMSKRPINISINGSVAYDFGWSELLKGLSAKLRYAQTFGTDFDNRLGTYVELLRLKQRGGSGGHRWIDEGPFLGDVGGHLMDENNLNILKGRNDNRLVRYIHNKEQYQVNFDVNYARSFGLHSVSAVFSMERMEREERKQTMIKGEPIADYTGEFNGALGDLDLSSDRLVGASLGYIGRLDYDYDNKYLLSFLVRSDASTKFSPENYWGTFYSLSAGWVISEEDFFRSVSWIDFLKIRVGWALTGTDSTGDWTWMQRFTYNHDKGPVLGGDNNKKFSMALNSAPNRNAHWDKKYKHSIGFDARFLRSRLSVTVDGYFDRGRDLLAQRSGASVPITIGADLANENYNAQDNFGVDLALGWRDRIGSVGYYVNVNTSWSDGRARKRDWPATPSFNSVVKDGPLNTGTWGVRCDRNFKKRSGDRRLFSRIQYHQLFWYRCDHRGWT